MAAIFVYEVVFMFEKYKEYLIECEKSGATIEKYMRDIRVFMNFWRAGKLAKILFWRIRRRF